MEGKEDSDDVGNRPFGRRVRSGVRREAGGGGGASATKCAVSATALREMRRCWRSVGDITINSCVKEASLNADDDNYNDRLVHLFKMPYCTRANAHHAYNFNCLTLHNSTAPYGQGHNCQSCFGSPSSSSTRVYHISNMLDGAAYTDTCHLQIELHDMHDTIQITHLIHPIKLRQVPFEYDLANGSVTSGG